MIGEHHRALKIFVAQIHCIDFACAVSQHVWFRSNQFARLIRLSRVCPLTASHTLAELALDFARASTLQHRFAVKLR
jgi:hypothetical protein